MENKDRNKITKSLSFEVEAIPQDNVIQLTSTANSTPLNVKIKVRKKNEGTNFGNAIITIPKYGRSGAVAEKIRLVNSDQTIMSFNVFLEDENNKKITKKPRRSFFGLFKSGGWINSILHEDTNKYEATTSKKKIKSNSASKSENEIIFCDNSVDLLNLSCRKNLKKGILGKCKPGGCLDPPFDEDRYPYKVATVKGPKCQVTIPLGSTYENNITSAIEKNDSKQKSKKTIKNKLFSVYVTPKVAESVNQDTNSILVQNLFQANNLESTLSTSYSNSLITYPPVVSDSEHNNYHEINKKSPRNKISIDANYRQSFQNSAEIFFIPKKYTSSQRQNDNTSSNITLTSSRQHSTINLCREMTTAPDKNAGLNIEYVPTATETAAAVTAHIPTTRADIQLYIDDNPLSIMTSNLNDDETNINIGSQGFEKNTKISRIFPASNLLESVSKDHIENTGSTEGNILPKVCHTNIQREHNTESPVDKKNTTGKDELDNISETPVIKDSQADNFGRNTTERLHINRDNASYYSIKMTQEFLKVPNYVLDATNDIIRSNIKYGIDTQNQSLDEKEQTIINQHLNMSLDELMTRKDKNLYEDNDLAAKKVNNIPINEISRNSAILKEQRFENYQEDRDCVPDPNSNQNIYMDTKFVTHSSSSLGKDLVKNLEKNYSVPLSTEQIEVCSNKFNSQKSLNNKANDIVHISRNTNVSVSESNLYCDKYLKECNNSLYNTKDQHSCNITSISDINNETKIMMEAKSLINEKLVTLNTDQNISDINETDDNSDNNTIGNVLLNNVNNNVVETTKDVKVTNLLPPRIISFCENLDIESLIPCKNKSITICEFDDAIKVEEKRKVEGKDLKNNANSLQSDKFNFDTKSKHSDLVENFSNAVPIVDKNLNKIDEKSNFLNKSEHIAVNKPIEVTIKKSFYEVTHLALGDSMEPNKEVADISLDQDPISEVYLKHLPDNDYITDVNNTNKYIIDIKSNGQKLEEMDTKTMYPKDEKKTNLARHDLIPNPEHLNPLPKISSNISINKIVYSDSDEFNGTFLPKSSFQNKVDFERKILSESLETKNNDINVKISFNKENEPEEKNTYSQSKKENFDEDISFPTNQNEIVKCQSNLGSRHSIKEQKDNGSVDLSSTLFISRRFLDESSNKKENYVKSITVSKLLTDSLLSKSQSDEKSLKSDKTLLSKSTSNIHFDRLAKNKLDLLYLDMKDSLQDIQNKNDIQQPNENNRDVSTSNQGPDVVMHTKNKTDNLQEITSIGSKLNHKFKLDLNHQVNSLSEILLKEKQSKLDNTRSELDTLDGGHKSVEISNQLSNIESYNNELKNNTLNMEAQVLTEKPKIFHNNSIQQFDNIKTEGNILSQRKSDVIDNFQQKSNEINGLSELNSYNRENGFELNNSSKTFEQLVGSFDRTVPKFGIKSNISIESNTAEISSRHLSSISFKETTTNVKSKCTPQITSVVNNNQTTESSTELNYNDEEVIVLDIGIQSYINKESQRVIKSLDTNQSYQRNKNDTITTINSIIHQNGTEIKVPIDSTTEMSISIAKRNIFARKADLIKVGQKRKQLNLAKSKNILEDVEVPTRGGGAPGTADNILHKTLSFVYEQQLIPLRNIIKSLREDIDLLASHQQFFTRKLVDMKKNKVVRINRVNRKCGCLKNHKDAVINKCIKK